MVRACVAFVNNFQHIYNMLEIKRSIKEPKRDYAFTMRKVSNPHKVSEVTYVNQINYFKSHLTNVDFKVIRFEHTSGLHCHGIVTIPNNVSLTRFRVRGWSIKLEEIYDYSGWCKYINKDQDEDEDLTVTPQEEVFEIPKIKLFGNI